MLLVLDNFEQIAAAAPRVACTARTRAGLQGVGHEQDTAPPLAESTSTKCRRLRFRTRADYPTSSALAKYEAVALFTERAEAAKPGFALTTRTRSVVAEICRRLDGLPLALELAAARMRVTVPLSARSAARPAAEALTGGAQDLDERQQTLRATIEWSYDLLCQRRSGAVRLLGVFVGGCRLEAAEAVCNPEDELGIDGARWAQVSGREEPASPDERRGRRTTHWMLETIREYAHERLAELPIASVLRRKHAEYLRSFAVDADAKRHADWLDRLEGEGPNFHAALTWWGAERPHLTSPSGKRACWILGTPGIPSHGTWLARTGHQRRRSDRK